MSIINIKKVYCVRNPSPDTQKPKGIDSILFDLDRSRTPIPKRTMLTESLESKYNTASSRGEIKKEGTICAVAKTLTRNTSLVLGAELKKMRPTVPSLKTEGDRESSVEKKEKQEKRFALWKKINEIKAAIHRQSLLQDQRIFPTKANVRKVLECLELWTETDSSLKELMAFIVSTIKSAIYIDANVSDLLKKSFSFIDNEELKNLCLSLETNHTPYFSFLAVLSKEFRQNSKHFRNKDDVLRIQNLEDSVKQKEKLIEDLQEELDRRITIKDSEKLLADKKNLTEKYEDLKKDYERIEKKNEDLNNQILLLKENIDESTEQIQLLCRKISDLEFEKEDLEENLMKARDEIEVLRQSIAQFRDFKDKCIMKLGIVKNEISNLNLENEKLTNENRVLSIRAAIGFEGLTPRPDYKKLQSRITEELKLFKMNGNNKLCPTTQIVEDLVKKVQQLYKKVSSLKNKDKPPRIPSSMSQSEISHIPLSKIINQLGNQSNGRVTPSLTERRLNTESDKDIRDNDIKRVSHDSIYFMSKNSGDEERTTTLTTRRSNEFSSSNELEGLIKINMSEDRSLSVPKQRIKLIKKEKQNENQQDALEIADELLNFILEKNHEIEKNFE